MKSVITEAAWAATRTKNTFYCARYHRLAARRGKKRALIAVGHSLLKSVYHVLKDGCEYRELGGDYLDKKQEKKRKDYLKKELEKLGYEVGLSPKAKETAENTSEKGEPDKGTVKEKGRKKKE